MSNKKVLTGDRPTGKLHIGHYFGSLKRRVELQNEFETYILIADVQALTDNFNNPEKVRKNVREVLIDYLSCGIDPEKSTIYIQSMIPETAELTVFYSNLVTIARLERNPTVKTELSQKKEVFGDSVTYGFLGYPVSQAADITIMDGTIVPAGEDQEPLIEQCREIVRKFNSIYGEVLREPEILLSEGKRIKGLDGNEKMGKSLGNAISEECKTVCDECKQGKRGCVACKKQLANNVIEFLRPMREKREYYESHPEIVEKILKEGTKKAREEAKKNMARIKKAMKLNYFEGE